MGVCVRVCAFVKTTTLSLHKLRQMEDKLKGRGTQTGFESQRPSGLATPSVDKDFERRGLKSLFGLKSLSGVVGARGRGAEDGISKEAAVSEEEEEDVSLGGRRPIGLNSCSRMRSQQCLPQSLTPCLPLPSHEYQRGPVGCLRKGLLRAYYTYRGWKALKVLWGREYSATVSSSSPLLLQARPPAHHFQHTHIHTHSQQHTHKHTHTHVFLFRGVVCV